MVRVLMREQNGTLQNPCPTQNKAMAKRKAASCPKYKIARRLKVKPHKFYYKRRTIFI